MACGRRESVESTRPRSSLSRRARSPAAASAAAGAAPGRAACRPAWRSRTALHHGRARAPLPRVHERRARIAGTSRYAREQRVRQTRQRRTHADPVETPFLEDRPVGMSGEVEHRARNLPLPCDAQGPHPRRLFEEQDSLVHDLVGDHHPRRPFLAVGEAHPHRLPPGHAVLRRDDELRAFGDRSGTAARQSYRGIGEQVPDGLILRVKPSGYEQKTGEGEGCEPHALSVPVPGMRRKSRRGSSSTAPRDGWAVLGSNQWPSPCKGDALPLS